MTLISSSASGNAEFKRSDLHQRVTDTIIRQLETGTVPWLRPWKGAEFRFPGLPLNAVSNKHYRGINIILLWGTTIEHEYQSDEWATFKQWQEKKEKIRKDEKGTMIVYYDKMEKEVDGEIVKIPFLKSSYVFNRCQLESYQPEDNRPSDHNYLNVANLDIVDDFVANTQATIIHEGSSAHYDPGNDLIRMPQPEKFFNTDSCTATEGYYSTLFHELTHWSGAEKRLNRTKGNKFGDENYATEELVAEMGAAFLCAKFDMATAEKGSHASYIENWLQVLRNDKHCVIAAASQASKAVEYIDGLQPAYMPH